MVTSKHVSCHVIHLIVEWLTNPLKRRQTRSLFDILIVLCSSYNARIRNCFIDKKKTKKSKKDNKQEEDCRK